MLQPLLLAPPGVGEGRRWGRSGDRERREQRTEQALLRVAAAVADLEAVALEPGHEPGVEHRRLAHARAAVQEQDRRPAGLLDLLVQLADRVAPAEEDLGVAGREPGEVAERALREVLLGQRRQAEQGVAGRVGQAPARGQLGPGAEPQLPGEAAVVGRRTGRHVLRAEVAMEIEEARLGCGSPRRAHPSPRGVEGGGDGRAGGQLGVEGGCELPGDLILDGPRRGDDGRHAGLEQAGDLGPRRAAVEEDQLQVAPLAQERRQALGVRDTSPRRARLEQEPVLAGMPAVMEDRHPVAMLGEDLEDLLETGVGPDDQLAQALALGRLQDALKLPQLLRQVAEIAIPVLLVGKGKDDHRQVSHDARSSSHGVPK